MPPATSAALRATASLLSTLLFQPRGYLLLVPLLLLFETALSLLLIRRVPFTEIDFQTYIAQADLFRSGHRDYRLLDPPGGSGPCVYPALHLYLYSGLSWLTHHGANLLPGQLAFAVLLAATLLIVAHLYRRAGAPPICLLPLVLSKRIHSIFLLRMFNDPLALLLAYAAFGLCCAKRWNTASVFLALAVGVKMNVLLFLPAFATVVFQHAGFSGLLRGGVIGATTQILLALPFFKERDTALVYVKQAFDLGRRFMYKWTVNWRFVSEERFESKGFAKVLLGAHLVVLGTFAVARWTGIGKGGVRWIRERWSGQRGGGRLKQSDVREMLTTLFTANLIGVVCSRSLHYQFYSWYFHQVPFLLWRARLPLTVKLVIPLVVEWAWNVFPSTKESSVALLACHVVLLGGLWAVPREDEELLQQQQKQASLSDATVLAKPLTGQVTDGGKSKQEVEEDDREVEELLRPTDGGVKSGGKQSVDASASTSTSAPGNEDQGETDEEGTEDEAEGEEEEDAVVRTVRRRIEMRKKVVAQIARGVPWLRHIMVLGALALLVTMLDASSPLSRSVYVDENALQPGQASVYWDYFDVTYADMVSEKVERLGRLGTVEERAEFVRSELASYGLEPKMQRYEFPELTGEGEGEGRKGVNVYARWKAPRIDGREAVVVSASWRSRWRGEGEEEAKEEEGKGQRRINVRGISTVLTLARYLKTTNWSSKDIVFVISDGYLEGVKAWTDAYFGGPKGSIPLPKEGEQQAGPGGYREEVQDAGATIWNAVTVDYPADSFGKLVMLHEGVDGQLPNLDALNTVLAVADRGGVEVGVGGEADTEEGKARWWWEVGRWVGEARVRGARNALHQMVHGVRGGASGAHGVFQRHHIDALTLYAVPARGPYGFYHLGRLLEAYIRSLSNLLERLHHSQFLYLLVSPRRFVPIGIAIVVPLLLAVAITVRGLEGWNRGVNNAEMRRKEWVDKHGGRREEAERWETTWERVAEAVGEEMWWCKWNELGTGWREAATRLAVLAMWGAGVVVVLTSSVEEKWGYLLLLPPLFHPTPRTSGGGETNHPLVHLISGMVVACLATLSPHLATFLGLAVYGFLSLPLARLPWALRRAVAWCVHPVFLKMAARTRWSEAVYEANVLGSVSAYVAVGLWLWVVEAVGGRGW
ncbi:dolichyl-P-Man:Man(5)GlcNAc(2)-PP-dolichol alpha-1,3-mannosyltransferase [Thecaphora frezii]